MRDYLFQIITFIGQIAFSAEVEELPLLSGKVSHITIQTCLPSF